MNVICGLPRSGSTLLCNILTQNKSFEVSKSTSCTPQLLNNFCKSASDCIEITSDLINDKQRTEQRLINISREICLSAFNDRKKTLFDKGRGWIYTLPTLKKLFPGSKAIVVVRNLSDIFASIEKQHLRFPLLDTAKDHNEKTSLGRANQVFDENGVVGSLVYGIVEASASSNKDIIFLQYEALVADPELIIRRLYGSLGIKQFKHDFNKIVDQSNDVDGLYLNKYPHNGSGKVKPVSDSKNYVTQDIKQMIDNKFKHYNSIFGY